MLVVTRSNVVRQWREERRYGSLCISVSPQEASHYQGTSIRRRDVDIGSFNDKYSHSGRTKKISNQAYVNAHMLLLLAKGGGSKLSFEDKNTKTDIWLDLSPSAQVRCSFLEGLAYKLCNFVSFFPFSIWLVVPW